MSRAKWKFPLVFTNINKIAKKRKVIYIKSRSLIITPSFVNKRVYVYNGKTYTNFLVLKEMVGHKFGEFSPTKKNFTFKKKK